VYRYFVLIWDARNPEATADAVLVAARLQDKSSDWTLVAGEAGLQAFHAGAGGGIDATSRDQLTSCEARILTGRRRGVVFGRAFRCGQELQAHATGEPLDATESERIGATDGVHLIENCWGRYVAVVLEASGQAVWVLRDPTGGLPCFFTAYKTVRIVFSDVESCLGLGLLPLSLNWRFVESVVPFAALQIRETGLNEVTELQPGERARMRNDRIDYELLWKPHEIAAEGRITDPVRAVSAVRETVKLCVHAWASLHRTIVHNLSGGLDSSIVLGCIKSAPNNPRVTCLHYYAPASHEDEREYARLAARHMDAELVECALDPTNTRLEKLLEIRPFPKPWFYIYDLVHSPIEARVMADAGATGSFSGAGGDGLFVQARADLAVADYLQHFGYRPGVLGVALNAARINRDSVWQILRDGVVKGWKRPSPSFLSEFGDPRSVVSRKVFERARNDDSLVHVWLRAAEGVTHGLLWQILCLSAPIQFYGSFGGATAIERTAVLMSQPLMEMCLRIPTYVWISGGRDRSVARRAFADVLPQVIARRTHKGLADRYNRTMLDENVAFMRDMLLDGLLVREGLLDRKAMETLMGRGDTTGSYEYNAILRQHLSTEVWLRRWSALTTASAASG
jgi:asparagine synthase (glutamine-hydrolysing)